MYWFHCALLACIATAVSAVLTNTSIRDTAVVMRASGPQQNRYMEP